MHIQWDIFKKLIFKFILKEGGVKTTIKNTPGEGDGVLIRCLGHHSQTFSALKLLPADFVISFLILISFTYTTHLARRFWLTIRPKVQYDSTNP